MFNCRYICEFYIQHQHKSNLFSNFDYQIFTRSLLPVFCSHHDVCINKTWVQPFQYRICSHISRPAYKSNWYFGASIWPKIGSPSISQIKKRKRLINTSFKIAVSQLYIHRVQYFYMFSQTKLNPTNMVFFVLRHPVTTLHTSFNNPDKLTK